MSERCTTVCDGCGAEVEGKLPRGWGRLSEGLIERLADLCPGCLALACRTIEDRRAEVAVDAAIPVVPAAGGPYR